MVKQGKARVLMDNLYVSLAKFPLASRTDMVIERHSLVGGFGKEPLTLDITRPHERPSIYIAVTEDERTVLSRVGFSDLLGSPWATPSNERPNA